MNEALNVVFHVKLIKNNVPGTNETTTTIR